MRIDRGTTRFRKGLEVTESHKTGLPRAAGQGLAGQPCPTIPARNRASGGEQGSPRDRVSPWGREQAALGCRPTEGVRIRHDVRAGVRHGPRVVVQGFPMAVSGGLHHAMDTRANMLWASPEA